MVLTPMDRITKWLGRRAEGNRTCHVCGVDIDINARRVDGFFACSEEHAEDIARERAW